MTCFPPTARAKAHCGRSASGALARQSFKLANNQTREIAKEDKILVLEAAGLAIDQTQRSDAKARAQPQRHPGVETDLGLPGYQWIISKPRVFKRIRYDERIILEDRVTAE